MVGVVWSSEDTQGPQHRLQTSNQVVQYVKGVRKRGYKYVKVRKGGSARFASLHWLPTTAMFKVGVYTAPCVNTHNASTLVLLPYMTYAFNRLVLFASFRVGGGPGWSQVAGLPPLRASSSSLS
eukprot:9398566-Pyramimonas_sp.AAC.1